jgi:RNA recognition motif-containing protein
VLNRQGDFVRNPQANIIVRNINKSLAQSAVYLHFSQFGKISSCKLSVFDDGTSRGFAYIQYANVEDAQKSILALNKKVWEGNTLEIDIHKKRDERAPADTENFTNLYVQGFS